MDAANQQKILGYFIEEAKEHLETLEQGILELSSVAEDADRVNEMFRAAHSVKGGAAMLGYTSIQKTAHRLEDAFKILKENSIKVDQKLESLFFSGYDILQDLIERLQSTFGLQEEEADAIVAKGEPAFVELQKYLNQLLSNDSAAETASSDWGMERRKVLKQMLSHFKGKASLQSRQQLQELCKQLEKLAPSQEKAWQQLLQKAQKAIANPQHSYSTLAPVIITDLKQGSDLLELEKGEDIVSTPGLEQLATAKLPQVLLPLEPQTVANTLLQIFNGEQISQIRQLLDASI